jgi:type II secretory pathway component PulC
VFKPVMLMAMLFSVGAVAQTMTIDGEVFRDPTQPPQLAPAVLPAGAAGPAPDLSSRMNLVVSFVRAGGTQPVAIINNTVLTIGESIDGAMVTDIRPGQVVMTAQGQEFVLSTFGRSVREPVN